ncbi:hypothetical protein F5Y03DRAFT_372653 [Xylaria venustula]|nr:hypothetical protein F5Y03DRAFT_372653 [Xylaria venustula]
MSPHLPCMADPGSITGPAQNGVKRTTHLELDFTPDNPTFARARGDETLYWSSSYKELSHPNLFTCAAKTRERLIPDLKKTLAQLSKSRVRQILNKGKLHYDLEPPEKRYQLRLTGHAYVGITKRIRLIGYVWIQCSDAYSMWKIKKRLAELTWPNCCDWAPIHVYLERIVAAGSKSETVDNFYDNRIGVNLGGDYQLHSDILWTGKTDSFCGRPCRSRITFQSKVVSESFFRIGGIVRVNGSVDTLSTTAHGITSIFVTEYISSFGKSDAAKYQFGTADIISYEDTDEDDIEVFLSQEQQAGLEPEHSHTDALGYIEISNSQRWEPLTPFDTVTYIAQGRQLDAEPKWDMVFREFNADYALFRLPKQPQLPLGPPPRNFYNYAEQERRTPTNNFQAISPREFETGHILLGEQGVIPVRLFLDEIEISMRGGKLKTRKLQAPKMLAQGTSGSWVVRGGELCGMIIAIYENEPYALFQPATEVARDMMSFGRNIETLSLPPKDNGEIDSDKGTIISTYETSTRRPTEISSLTQFDPTPTSSHQSDSQNIPPSSHFREHQEQNGGHPGSPDASAVYRTQRQSNTTSTNGGASTGSMTYGQAVERNKLSEEEGTALQKHRIDRWLQDSTEGSLYSSLYGNEGVGRRIVKRRHAVRATIKMINSIVVNG